MKNENQFLDQVKSGFALIVIPSTIVVSFLLFYLVLGNGQNFKDGDPDNDPINVLGIVFKGGIIVPFLLAGFLLVVTFSIERFITIGAAYGKGNLSKFIREVKEDVKKDNISGALKKCDAQKGSVGNVINSVLNQYSHIVNDHALTREQKKLSAQQEIEEALALELPMLEKNLTIIATLASTATLIGLLGTVIGMIKAFAALATSGAPDASALANGISEALINTALGIGSSALAIWSYNYFTSKIDSLTFHIDEIGFSITQHIAVSHGKPKVSHSNTREALLERPL